MSKQNQTAPAVLTFDTVVELLSVLDGSNMPTTIDFRDGALRLKVQRGLPAGVHTVTQASEPVVAHAEVVQTSPAPAAPETAGGTSAASTPIDAAQSNGQAVESPIAGVFYHAPAPGEAPFVEVGTRVSADDVIGIVEVMKLMNTVRAGVSGVVTEVCSGDAELVEFGQALVRIDTEA
ncbi:MAG: acetyl-CoA carboxylase biotin carboxyl carrier protein [Leucobacter sp.]